MRRPDYWQHKVSNFLHDPIHKPLQIQGHEQRAEHIARSLHQMLPSKDTYQAADCIASGLTRAALPGYSRDQNQNGAVDFLKSPVLTHPLVRNQRVEFRLPEVPGIDTVHADVLKIMKEDIGENLSAEELENLKVDPEKKTPLNAHFNRSNDPEGWSRALYMYLYFALKKRLRAENVARLGGLWELIPADTRMPDHPLWHHCGLASALGSAMDQDENGHASIGVFSITPVQAFISRARKLRDHWVGSVILSYLSFVGICYLVQNLGPDHVMYPSLHDQPLIEMWLKKEYHLSELLKEPSTQVYQHQEQSKSIASFPNKFVFLAASQQMQSICQGVEKAIREEWMRLSSFVCDFLAPKGQEATTMRHLFQEQISDYWQFSYAASKLFGLEDKDTISQVVHESKWRGEARIVEAFARPFGASGKQYARLYATTHTTVQSLLASSKLRPQRTRNSQQGEKCPLCGEFEVLHDFTQAGKTEARKYKNAVHSFWDNLRQRMNSQGSFSQVGEHERLCAVCAVKRFLPMALAKHKNEILSEVLSKADATFPSTTEMAAHDYLNRLEAKVPLNDREHQDLVDALHESELETKDDESSNAVDKIKKKGKDHGITYTDRDKYYAVLLMDGDKMGDLINGTTIDACWQDVLHPELRKRFQNQEFSPLSPLRPVLNDKRSLNPSLHVAISGSLNSFARFGVAPVIRESGGRLIYAGGDDVCAIVPLNTALDAAVKIFKAYSLGFVRYAAKGAESLSGTISEYEDKIGMHLGQASGISISGALVIAHHKQPLREVLRDAHALLDGVAKDRAGRNALAIRLKKRSGSDYDVWFNWDERNLFCSQSELLSESFQHVMDGVASEDIASRLVYRLGDLKGAVAPLATSVKQLEDNRDKINRLFAYEVRHSGKISSQNGEEREKVVNTLAARLAGMCIRYPSTEADWFNPESAVVARFLAPKDTRREHGHMV